MQHLYGDTRSVASSLGTLLAVEISRCKFLLLIDGAE